MPAKKHRTENLPLWIRIILKIPKLSLEGFSDVFQGLFWILILPALAALYTYVNLFLMVSFTSPFNLVMVFSVLCVVVILSLRVIVERTLASEEAVLNEWDSTLDRERLINEYIEGSRVARARFATLPRAREEEDKHKK
jgi:hypothetical protein